MNEDIGSRITEARQMADITKSALARRLGVTPQSVQDWESGSTKPKAERLAEMAGVLGVSLHWLAFGEGEAHALTEKESDVVAVPLMNPTPSAGWGSEKAYDVAIAVIDLYKDWLRRKLVFSSFSALKLYSIRGDSMETTLCNGDTVLVDCGVTEIVEDGIYVTLLDDSMFVKRFQRIPGRQLKMISDNKKYDPVLISPEDSFRILGRVIYSWHGVPH